MSPEQAMGQSVNAQTDVFALGAVFLELLTGKKCFDADTDLGVLEKVRNAIIDLPEDLPEEIKTIIKKALAKDKADRYLNCQGFEQDVASYLNQNTPYMTSEPLRDLMDHLFSDEEHSQVAPIKSLETQTQSILATRIVTPGEGELSNPEATRHVVEDDFQSDEFTKTQAVVFGNSDKTIVEQATTMANPAELHKNTNTRSTPDNANNSKTNTLNNLKEFLSKSRSRIKKHHLAASLALAFGLFLGIITYPPVVNDSLAEGKRIALQQSVSLKIVEQEKPEHTAPPALSPELPTEEKTQEQKAVAFVDLEQDRIAPENELPIAETNENAPKGKVHISARPWGKIKVGGRVLGSTPTTISLSEGQHQITVFNPALNKTVSTNVKIVAGKSMHCRASFGRVSKILKCD